jgi:hypothetical protein
MGNTAIGDAVEKAHNILQTPAAASYDEKATIIFATSLNKHCNH